MFQINGSRPSVCWKEIYKKIDKLQNNTNGFRFEVDGNITLRKPGSYMFGFSIKKVFELIQVCSCHLLQPPAELLNVGNSKSCFMMELALNCAFDW